MKPGTFSGYWLEVLSYADQGNNSKTKELIPGVVEKDWDTNSETQARTSLLQLQDKLMSIRYDSYGNPIFLTVFIDVIIVIITKRKILI